MTLTPASIDQFLKSLSENGLSQNTLRAYRADLTGFLEWLNRDHMTHRLIAPLEKEAKIYLNDIRPNLSPRTVVRKVTALRTYGKFMGELNFLADYRGPKPPKAQPHPIDEGVNGVLDMLAESQSNQHRALLALCGLVGMRVSEARSVMPISIVPSEMEITFQGKGDKWRTIPISHTAWLFIKGAYTDSLVLDQTGMTPLIKLSDSGARKFITSVAKRAELASPVSSHDLRATFATAAYAKTKDLRAVQELLGHACSSTTELYTGISMEAMRDATTII